MDSLPNSGAVGAAGGDGPLDAELERLFAKALVPEGAEVIQRVTARFLEMRAAVRPGPARGEPTATEREALQGLLEWAMLDGPTPYQLALRLLERGLRYRGVLPGAGSGPQTPDERERIVKLAVDAAWRAAWPGNQYPSYAPPANEGENQILWRQVRAVVEVVLAAVPRSSGAPAATPTCAECKQKMTWEAGWYCPCGGAPRAEERADG